MSFQPDPRGGWSLPPVGKPLGSLAQSAREKQLNQARWILIIVGILTIAVNGFLFVAAEAAVKAQIDKEVADLRAQRVMVIDQAELAKFQASATRLTRVVAAGMVALGGLFVFFGVILKKYPVPISVTSLVLYVGAAAGFAILDPSTLLKGIVVKVLIVFGLAKAVQAAVAYEKEQKAGSPTA